MGSRIHTIPLGFDQTYIVKDQGAILIDSGEPKKGKVFLNGLKKTSIKPEEIQLIVLTHGHWDHIGSAAEIKEITGAEIVMHKNEKHCLEESFKLMPPGVTIWGSILDKLVTWFIIPFKHPGVTIWGSILDKLVTWFIIPFKHIRATEVDIVLKDEEFSLNDYGIKGKVIHTPGHSSGSVSILLDTGEAFVGDLAMNKFPLRLRPGLAIFAEDWPKLIESWQKLFDFGVKFVYPAHGDPFSADIIENELSKGIRK
jgi:glyoxylase-like metal-dependent hydrolase (beta-lactamase superfamily II)